MPVCAGMTIGKTTTCIKSTLLCPFSATCLVPPPFRSTFSVFVFAAVRIEPVVNKPNSSLLTLVIGLLLVYAECLLRLAGDSTSSLSLSQGPGFQKDRTWHIPSSL